MDTVYHEGQNNTMENDMFQNKTAYLVKCDNNILIISIYHVNIMPRTEKHKKWFKLATICFKNGH